MIAADMIGSNHFSDDTAPSILTIASLDDVADRGRDGITGARKAGNIGFASLRGGSVAGDHMVIFASDNERIELVHRAENRSIFANGAVKAAVWLMPQKAGRYNMQEVLGL